MVCTSAMLLYVDGVNPELSLGLDVDVVFTIVLLLIFMDGVHVHRCV